MTYGSVTLNPGTGGEGVATDEFGGKAYQLVKMQHGAEGVANEATAATPLPVAFLRDAATHVITTATPLAAGATYTSASHDSLMTGAFVTHYIIADVDGTHYYEESIDNTNWDVLDADTVFGGTPFEEAHLVQARYHRTRYVNGGTIQTVFRHQMISRVVGAPHTIGISSNDNIIAGDKTHNANAPSADALESLGHVAKAAAPTYSEGAAVMARVTLSGDQAVTLDGEAVVLGAGSANIGDVDILSIAAGDNNIGNVDIVSLPSLVAGSANIGDVDVLTVPAPLSTTGGGTEATALRVTIASDSTGVLSIDDNGSSITVDGTFWQATQPVSNAGTFATQSASTGNVAHDAADSGNPMKVGGIARTANPTVVAALDRVDAFYDTEGRQITQPFAPRALTVHNTITLTTTSETTLIAAAASIFHDVLGIFIANSSATAVTVTIKDATAGTTRAVIYAPAGQNAGFMLPIPMTASAANANWTATLSAGVSSVYVTAIAVKKTG